jgi:two-component system sensor histidine kinase YesM
MNGQIIINISKTPDNLLIIKITDNGKGMDDDRLKELNNRINSASLDSISSIGLYNINQRIKLLYGAAYGITFSSQLNEGTTVTLIIPAIVVKEA